VPKYRVIKQSYLRVNGSVWPRLCLPDEIVEFNEAPGASLEPLDDAARAAKARSVSAPRMKNGLQIAGSGT
jgi:hypothetical protein